MIHSRCCVRISVVKHVSVIPVRLTSSGVIGSVSVACSKTLRPTRRAAFAPVVTRAPCVSFRMTEVISL